MKILTRKLQEIHIFVERQSIILLYDKCDTMYDKCDKSDLDLGIREDFWEEVTVELSFEGRIGLT